MFFLQESKTRKINHLSYVVNFTTRGSLAHQSQTFAELYSSADWYVILCNVMILIFWLYSNTTAMRYPCIKYLQFIDES